MNKNEKTFHLKVLSEIWLKTNQMDRFISFSTLYLLFHRIFISLLYYFTVSSKINKSFILIFCISRLFSISWLINVKDRKKIAENTDVDSE